MPPAIHTTMPIRIQYAVLFAEECLKFGLPTYSKSVALLKG